MTTLHDTKGTQLTYVNGAPVSPADTEYHDPINDITVHEDAPAISIHEPTPVYEKNGPKFPTPHHYQKVPEKHNRAASVSPAGSKRVSINEDTVLAPNSQADVKRSGTWARGAGTFGIREDGANVSRHASLAERASTAHGSIPAEKRAALTKAEMKDAKRLSKIIKAEGKAEDKQLKAALKELASLQSSQKKAAAAESAATHAQSKAAREEQRASAAYLEAKTRWERATANLKVCEERLVLTRDQAQKTTAMVRRQAEEVEEMRERKATDDREREVKLANLKAGLVSP
ncbi:hypothetical protein CPB86DRAFT_771632 [Serendipita vermifera]|nr:hypothetical protein CPB86DRAFT_771632 [Serendipita vermifera]